MLAEIDIDAALKLLSSALVALFGAIAKRYFEDKPKLVTYLVHSVGHPMPPNQGVPTPSVNTHTIVVRNTGKKTAHNVRIDHAFLPESYVVFPPISHAVNRAQNGSGEILIPVLVPNEQVTISYLYLAPLLWHAINGPVKCDEGMAKSTPVVLSPTPNRAIRAMLWAFTFIGASTVVYFIIRYIPSAISRL